MSYRIDGFARLRQAIEMSDKLLPSLSDVNGDAARFPRGRKVRFEFGLFYDELIADASLIEQPRLIVFSTTSPASVVAIDSNNGEVRVNGGLTKAQWDTNDPAMAHIVVELPAILTADGVFTTAPSVTGDTEHFFTLIWGAGGDFIASGILKSFNPGATGVVGTPPVGGTTATIEAIDALLNARLANFVKFRGNPAGHTIELTSPSTAKTGKIGIDDEGNWITPNQVTT